MMYWQAIETHYIGPTNFRGARILARAAAGKIVVPWDGKLGIEQNHAVAAKALCDKMGWSGKYVAGGLADDSGMAWVCVDQTGAQLEFEIPRAE